MGRALAWVGGGLLGSVRPRLDRDAGAAADAGAGAGAAGAAGAAGSVPHYVTDPAYHRGRSHDTP